MELHPSPLGVALTHAFDVLDDSFATYLRYTALRTAATPSKRKITTAQPSYSVQSFEGGSVVEVELPGVSKDSLKLNVKDGTLTVAGDRIVRQERMIARTTGAGGGVIGCEREEEEGSSKVAGHANAEEEQRETELQAAQGATGEKGAECISTDSTEDKMTYKIEFTLPDSADPSRSRAEFRDGLLSIRIPRKTAVSQSVHVSVS